MQIDEDPSWQDPIIDYLANGNLPADKSKARKVQQKAARYYMHDNKLIRRSYSGHHLTCIKYPQTLEVLCKIHDSECGNHSGGRSLAQKALNIGYFLPTMRRDSAEYVKKCDRCQRYKPIPNLPAEWVSCHPCPTRRTWMIVDTDYFTKWIEAEALSSIKEADADHHKSVAHKQRPKGDAGCARNFLKGGLHAFCGKYPGSYPFPKGGRIDTQFSISSVLRETQGDDQSVLRETQPVKSVLRETQDAPGIS
ncbi:unnamed protein product [Prunus armeniaca]